MSRFQRVAFCNLLLPYTLVLMCAVSGSAQSPPQDSIESVFPKSFDATHKYTPYNYDSLLDHLESSFKITNTFVGERVKIIALYGETLTTINRTKPLNPYSSLMGAYGCTDPLCDKLEAISGEEVSLAKDLGRLFHSLAVYVYLRDQRQYSMFLQSATICSAMNPCYLLAAGTLQTTKVHMRNTIGIVSQGDIIYLDTDKINLFKSSDNIGVKLIAKGLWSGFSLGLKVYSNFSGNGQ